jgi:hypothetical protein
VNEPRFRREALFAQLAGELDALLARVEQLPPLIDSASDELVGTIERYEARIDALTAAAQANAMTYIVRRTKETADDSLRTQTTAMENAANALFDQKIAPRLAQLAATLDASIDRCSRARSHAWLFHAATAAVISVATAAATVAALLPGK